MSTLLSTRRGRTTYEFIKVQRESFDVRVLCRLLHVAPPLLRVAEAAALEPRPGRRAAPAADPSVVHGQPRHLRRAEGVHGPTRGRRDQQ